MVQRALLSFSARMQTTWRLLVTADPLRLEEATAIGSELGERGTLSPFHFVPTGNAVSEDSEAREVGHVGRGSGAEVAVVVTEPLGKLATVWSCADCG